MGIPGVSYEAVASIWSGQCLYVWTVRMRVGFLQDELNTVGDKSRKIKTIYVYTDFMSSL